MCAVIIRENECNSNREENQRWNQVVALTEDRLYRTRQCSVISIPLCTLLLISV